MMTSTRRLGAALVMGLPLALLACGGSSPEAETSSPTASAGAAAVEPPPIEPCTYITKDEAEEALGMTLQEPRASAYNPVSRDAACEFDSAGDIQTLALSVRVANLANQQASIKRLEELVGDGSEPVEGLGDRAFYALGQLFIFKADRQATIIVSPIVRPQEKRLAARDAIARLVVERL